MTLSSNITWLHLHELFHAFLFWNNVCSEHSSIKWWVDRVTTLQRHLTRSKMNIQDERCQLKRSLAADLVVVRHSFWVGSQTRQQTNMQKWSQRKLQVEQQYEELMSGHLGLKDVEKSFFLQNWAYCWKPRCLVLYSHLGWIVPNSLFALPCSSHNNKLMVNLFFQYLQAIPQQTYIPVEPQMVKSGLVNSL